MHSPHNQSEDDIADTEATSCLCINLWNPKNVQVQLHDQIFLKMNKRNAVVCVRTGSGSNNSVGKHQWSGDGCLRDLITKTLDAKSISILKHTYTSITVASVKEKLGTKIERIQALSAVHQKAWDTVVETALAKFRKCIADDIATAGKGDDDPLQSQKSGQSNKRKIPQQQNGQRKAQRRDPRKDYQSTLRSLTDLNEKREQREQQQQQLIDTLMAKNKSLESMVTEQKKEV